MEPLSSKIVGGQMIIVTHYAKGKVAACNGNTSNLIANLRNNHPTVYDFAKQRAGRPNKFKATKVPHNKNR